MNDIFVRQKNMPFSIRGVTVPDENGDYNIYVNENLSDDGKIRALAHEMCHVFRGDIYSGAEASDLEAAINI